ncbi:MAG: hypothetical protein EOO61_20530 [Hymenobacter sp.]|nr:MAG: hypothetical protein EOO61_20530 [Hymenobacter sp.]
MSILKQSTCVATSVASLAVGYALETQKADSTLAAKQDEDFSGRSLQAGESSLELEDTLVKPTFTTVKQH